MKDKIKFKVSTFNLFNLALPGQRYYGRSYAQKDYEKKKIWIANQLDTLRADIVGFQEVFSEEALKEVVQASSYLKDAYFAFAPPIGSKPFTAIASRFPIRKTEFFTDFPELLNVDEVKIPIQQFSRAILKVEVEIKPKESLTLFVVHLKSKRPMMMDDEAPDDPVARAKGQARSLIRRASESCALRQIMMKTLKGRDQPVIVLGDVNDSGRAVTTEIISGTPPYRKMSKETKTKIWDVLLYNAKDIQARRSYHDFYFTHIHNGHHQALDHIMVSQELVSENPNRLGRVGFVKILNDHLIDDTLSNEKVKPWQSDHGQVVAEVEWGR